MKVAETDPRDLDDGSAHNSAHRLAESTVADDATSSSSDSFHTAIDDATSTGVSPYGEETFEGRGNERAQQRVEYISSSDDRDSQQKIEKKVRFLGTDIVHEYERRDRDDSSGERYRPFDEVSEDHVNEPYRMHNDRYRLGDAFINTRGVDTGLNNHGYREQVRGLEHLSLEENREPTSSSVFQPSRTPYIDILEELIDNNRWYPEETSRSQHGRHPTPHQQLQETDGHRPRSHRTSSHRSRGTQSAPAIPQDSDHRHSHRSSAHHSRGEDSSMSHHRHSHRRRKHRSRDMGGEHEMPSHGRHRSSHRRSRHRPGERDRSPSPHRERKHRFRFWLNK
ncbi:hypothetical protein DM02DRAFT_625058 [Periconia macrospinosa]|uniref:Uncharacterized protein n=1 Tax=Periconia macrospinosa TaxID=97972 RepID=A0A2V1E225_9PLEO|nr:hypothetical protein DM02DRAFT_625058 [Periconia macrospinosa]